MDMSMNGIHHVTAIAADPQRNLDFYTQVLGLRMVKLTVNFDMNETYHFYFADGAGSPGTVMTFFPWPMARKGMIGTGQAAVTAFRIPTGSIGYWIDRLKLHGTSASAVENQTAAEIIRLRDPDGLQLELVASDDATGIEGWDSGFVPLEYALRGFHGVSLLVDNLDASADLLGDVFRLTLVEEGRDRVSFEARPGAPGGRIDLVQQPGSPAGRMGPGTVHHVAFRAADDAEQQAWREKLLSLGFRVTPVMDRQYFHSIYFNEPGGVLFEIATDPPGFATDETPECLGSSLKLPPWLEPRRAEITRGLPPLRLPVACPEAR